MKIYVITKGEYSDYHICAATTDKKIAEFLKKVATTKGYGGEAYIEEFEDCAYLTPIEGTIYKVSISYDNDGRQYSCRAKEAYYLGDKRIDNDIIFQEEGYINKVIKEFGIDYICYNVYIVSDSEEKAEKIGIDMIQKYRAEEMGL